VFSRAKATPRVAAVTAELDHLDVGMCRVAGEADPLNALAGVERRVAVLVAEGATNREIAARLFVVKTVEVALTRMYRKLGIRSRVDVARLAAVRRGDDRSV
jgi:DNA-binding NarL/FixJ family response regulator